MIPPGARRVDPDAEAARLAEARKGTNPISAHAACEGCSYQGDADGLAYAQALIADAHMHAAAHGHVVRVEAVSQPLGPADG